MKANRALVRLAVALVVLCGVYVGGAVFLSGHVPSHSSVDGVQIGGMSQGQATVTLERVLATKASRPVHLKAPSRTVDLKPAAAGLEIDLEATLTDLSGFTLNPAKLVSQLTGGENETLKVRVDRAKLTAAVTRAARAVDSRPKEGSITFTDGEAKVVASAAGKQVNVPATTDAVVSAWPNRQLVRAVMKVTQPKLPAKEIKRAAEELAVPAMSGPVKVVAGRTTVLLQPEQYASVLSMTPDRGGRLRLRVDETRLLDALRAADPGLERSPVDATVSLVADQPVVVPAVVGVRIDESTVPPNFLAALTSASRTAKITMVPAPPKVTSAMVKALGEKRVMSTFTTHFPVNVPRTNNIKIAVRRLNGTFIRPGEQFSLNGTLGERTKAKGYRQAPVILDGRLVSDYGGGVSQVSTTMFNAAFFAAVRIDQYTPHSFYIARYPEGREATVSWPNVDQKWTNDTKFAILVKASVRGNDLTVTLLGTRAWDVKAVKGARRNVVKPKSIVDARPGCVTQAPTPGFDVTVARIFEKSGAQVKVSKFNTNYIPEDKVTCTHPAAR